MNCKKIGVIVICMLCIIGLGVGVHANTKPTNKRVIEKSSSSTTANQKNIGEQMNQNVNSCEMGHVNCDGVHNNVECDSNNVNCIGNHAPNECPLNVENTQPMYEENGHHGGNHHNQSGKRCNW